MLKFLESPAKLANFLEQRFLRVCYVSCQDVINLNFTRFLFNIDHQYTFNRNIAFPGSEKLNEIMTYFKKTTEEHFSSSYNQYK